MNEMTKRHAVLLEFFHRSKAMADEIVHLRQRLDRAERILAALRKPSEAVIDATSTALYYSNYTDYAIRAAVAAAEQEVDA